MSTRSRTFLAPARSRDADERSTDAAMAATGHRVGGRYYSVRNRARYLVAGVATTWELAPHASVTLHWDNGNTTTSAIERGSDPEVCPACDGVVDGPSWLDVTRCECCGRG